MGSFRFWRDDFAEEDEIKMVMSSILNRKVDNDSIALEFDMKVIFVFDCVGDFNSNLGWGLIPSVCDFEVLANNFLLGYIFFSELDDGASWNGLKLGLLDSFEEIGHVFC